MTTVLLEPFNNFTFAPWSTTSGWSVTAGRTGNCFAGVGSVTNNYTIPSANESANITLGFAWRVSAAGGIYALMELASDAGATTHLGFRFAANGSLTARRGTQNLGTLLGTSATGLITSNTWYYIEIQAVLNDTTGAVTVRIDGTDRLTLTAQDTKNAGTKTTFDTVRIFGPVASVTANWDDMYVATGPGEPFRGSQTIGAANVKTWNGTAYVDAPVKVWNGTAYVDALAVKTWNGSAFV